jgi:hypothetical protein
MLYVACHQTCASMPTLQNEEDVKKFARYTYPSMTKTQGNFKLTVSREWRSLFPSPHIVGHLCICLVLTSGSEQQL